MSKILSYRYKCKVANLSIRTGTKLNGTQKDSIKRANALSLLLYCISLCTFFNIMFEGAFCQLYVLQHSKVHRKVPEDTNKEI